MSSVVKMKCWLCPESFNTNKEMKNHMASATHNVMRVICPWCFHEEKTYRTSAELLKHVEKRHQYVTEETRKGEFFSEGNGFWMSLKPKDYSKICKPTDYESTPAMQTRAIVGRWLDKVKGKSRSRDQWKEGWETVKSKEVTPSSSKTYSPTKPSMPETKMKLIRLELTSKGQVAYFLDEGATIGDVWYKTEISKDILSDKKATESLVRRLHFKKPEKTIPSDFTTLVKDHEGTTRAAAKELGIPEKYINRTYRQIVSFSSVSKVSKKRKLECLAEELGMEEEIELSDPVTPIERPAQESEGSLDKPEVPEKEMTVPPKPSPPTTTPNEDSAKTACQSESDTNSSSDKDEVSDTEDKSLVDRALDLLITGAMPLIPPARREWGEVEQVTIFEKGATKIYWPPEDWENMGPEERCTAWTYMAMVMEIRRGVSVVTDIGELLDRYSFLALPGTAVGKTDKNPAARIRVGTYNILKDIHLGTIVGKEAENWMRMYEAARVGADKTAELSGILPRIAHVPLRLTVDQEPTI